MIVNWIVAVWEVVVATSPWLLFGFLLAGLIHRLIPISFLEKRLGRPGLPSILWAAAIGLPLPLCSCSVIPVAVSLRKHGAARGATASFLISTPEIGVDSFVLSYKVLGPVLAILRVVSAFFAAVSAGILIDRTKEPEPGEPAAEAPKSCCAHGNSVPAGKPAVSAGPAIDQPPRECAAETAVEAEAGLIQLKKSCCHEDRDRPKEGESTKSCCCSKPPVRSEAAAGKIAGELREILRYGFVQIADDIAPTLIVGFLIAGVLSVAITPEFFLQLPIGKFGQMAAMALFALPLYVCASASTPVAAVLLAKGLNPGAALVFMLAGPATNVTTMLMVASQLGRAALYRYLFSIFAVSMLFGALVDQLVEQQGRDWLMLPDHLMDHGTDLFSAAAAVILLLLLAKSMLLRLQRRLARPLAGLSGA